MTPPWNGLRAHQHDLLALRKIDTSLQACFERRCLHVVGIPAEARIPPSGIYGTPPGVSQSPQTGHVLVPNPGATQNGSERLATELRVVTRPRNGAYVDDTIDAVGGEQTNELVDRPRRMPNRKDTGL